VFLLEGDESLDLVSLLSVFRLDPRMNKRGAPGFVWVATVTARFGLLAFSGFVTLSGRYVG
jgi:hypothetical protein